MNLKHWGVGGGGGGGVYPPHRPGVCGVGGGGGGGNLALLAPLGFEGSLLCTHTVNSEPLI